MALMVEDLTFSYEGRSVLRDISLRAPEGKFTVILGKNGSGKSTLLKCMAGMMAPQKGRIMVFGKDLSRLSLSERAKLIGYLPQFHHPVFSFTVEEVVLTGRASYVFFTPGQKDKDKVGEAIKRVGLEAFRKRPYSELSGGERQLVLIARLLAQEPRIVVLDEPLSHLDFPNQIKFLNLIKEFTLSDLTVIAVLHDLNSAFLHGDHFVFLKDGRIRTAGPDERPWGQTILTQVYDTPVETIPFGERSLVIPR
jgi:iron complex transport system ATP-binding protein